MPPEFLLLSLLVLGIVAVPFILLVLLIKLLGRQERGHEDLSNRLHRIEREVDRTQELVRQIAKGASPVTPPEPCAAPAPTKAWEPEEPVVTAEVVPDLPPLPPLADEFVPPLPPG